MTKLARRGGLIALTAVIFLAAVPRASARESWIRMRTANFVLVGNAKQKQMREIALRLERFRSAFGRLLPTLQFNTRMPATVMVFDSLRSYEPFRPSNAAGHFMPGRDVDYIALTTESGGAQDSASVSFHEYTHLLLKNSSLRGVPTWFNEGLAEYYSTFALDNDQRVTLGRTIPRHLDTLRSQSLLPLATLFAVNARSPYYNEDQKQTIFYAQTWLLVHYLIHSQGGTRQAQLGRFVDLLMANTPVDQAFQSAFKTTYAEMEAGLQRYLSAESHPTTVFSFPKRLEFSREVSVELIGDAEAQAYQGDLLFHMHSPQAESFLKRALELDADQPRALASLGLLDSEAGRYVQARPLLERAVAADTGNSYLHYRYAEALLREAENEVGAVGILSAEKLTEIRSHLNSAIALDPEFTDSYRLTAYVSLLDGQQIPETIALLEKALARWPERFELTFMLGQCYLNRHDLARARAALDAVAKGGETEELREHAARLLRNIADIQEVEERKDAEIAGKAVVKEPPADAAENAEPRIAGFLALRPLVAGELRVRGEFVKIECTGGRGVVLVVRAGDRNLRFRSADLSAVRFSTFTAEVTGGIQISCGSLPRPQEILATYRPAPNLAGKFDGEAVAIEFIPPGTTLP